MAEDERENAMHVIAVDAMGGDNAPQAIVEGVNQAIADFKDIEIQLYGDEAKIKTYLTANERVSIVHTDEKINSDDEPAKAIRKKKKASMVLGAQAVKEKKASAVISAGNTGALLAAGLFVVGRMSVQVLCQQCQVLLVNPLICLIWVLMRKIQLVICINMLF